jgi:hypothetical protein
MFAICAFMPLFYKGKHKGMLENQLVLLKAHGLTFIEQGRFQKVTKSFGTFYFRATPNQGMFNVVANAVFRRKTVLAACLFYHEPFT